MFLSVSWFPWHQTEMGQKVRDTFKGVKGREIRPFAEDVAPSAPKKVALQVQISEKIKFRQ